MKIEVRGREICQSNNCIGLQADNNVEIRDFVLSRYYGDIDLSEGIAYLLFCDPSGRTGYIPLEKTVAEDSLNLRWIVGSELTAVPGQIKAQIKISGLDAALWHSEVAYFHVAESIPAESPQPVVFSTRAAMPRTSSLEAEPPITISERKINIPAVLQNIAVQNDENSETVTIQMPRFFDGHDLSEHIIILKTVSSGGRDDIVFSDVAVGDSELTFQWTLRPPQTSYNGTLTLQLRVEGKDFKWETDTATVNILRSIDAQPVIPSTPSILDGFAARLETAEQNAQSALDGLAGKVDKVMGARLMTNEEAEKLSGLHNYILPTAGNELGGVKNGGNVIVNVDGTMTAPTGGEGAVSSVNGKTPDSSGNVTITAEDTGARPDSWTPTAAEVGAATSGHTHSAATTSAAGFMSAADKTKLNGVATGANNYVLPVAGTALGGVKNGGNVTVNADGTMTAPEGGGSDGAVESVNGKTGAVTLTAADVSALSKTAQAVTNWDTATNTGLYTSDLTAQNLPDMEADSSGGVCNGLTINDAQFIMCSDYSMMNIWAGYRHYMGSGYFTEWTQFLSSSSGFSAITVTDWNNATQTGFYTSNADADNAPYPYTYDTCFGFVIANTSAAQQFVFRESKASNGIVDNALYTRSVRLNSRPVYYGEWQLVNKQAAADVPITAISGMTATTVQEALEENFQSVVDGKSSLETAITDKGGTVSKAGDVATFAELTAGVNSISGGGDDPFTPVQDGKTRIYISLQEGRTSPMLGVCPNGTVIVDWGDGTATDTLTGTSTSTYAWTPKHNYAAPGNYVITLSVDGIMGLIGGSSSGAGTPILRNSSDTDSANRAYSGSIYSVEIGENAVIGAAAFNRCDRMKNIFIPDSVTSIGINAFQYCYNLSSVSIPNGITKIDNYTFQYCYSLSSVSIPSSVTSIGTNAFSACYSLSNISIPDGVTIINTHSFNSWYHLSAVYFPGSVKTINSNAFSSCSGVAYFDFTKHTSVPALSATSAFSNIAADAQIRVPMELVDEWKAATNWATYASQIVGV